VADNTDESTRHYWPILGRELKRRLLSPWSHPSFLIFFIVAIIGLAPLGTWLELYDYAMDPNASITKVRASIVSFVPAFVAATAMQLIWAEQRMMRAVAIFVSAVCMLTLSFCISSKVSDKPAIAWGSFSIFIALMMWWVANANTREILDSPSQDLDAVGGVLDPNRPLPGSLSGFDTE
jgi:hypothetical protein